MAPPNSALIPHRLFQGLSQSKRSESQRSCELVICDCTPGEEGAEHRAEHPTPPRTLSLPRVTHRPSEPCAPPPNELNKYHSAHAIQCGFDVTGTIAQVGVGRWGGHWCLPSRWRTPPAASNARSVQVDRNQPVSDRGPVPRLLMLGDAWLTGAMPPLPCRGS